MSKNPQVFSELEMKIGGAIRERYTDTLEAELSPEQKKVLDEWMDVEIRHLLASSVSISKLEIRTASVVLMFGKKFEKVKEILRIMHDHELTENSELFGRLLGLL
ncbi:MAG: hypothetical protein A2Y33_01005 [Spirochaetes bacterium GWF1_51_8]|nr:MAG: hypothetical protein A2Y33_01005 [Spirochaetes bacterium GWF1_51_8]